MAIHDSNPDRRNLVVLSLCVIIFFLGAGTFTDENVRLQVVNINFEKPEILVYFIWIFLGWFTFRYWLINQGAWKAPFLLELQHNIPQILKEKYFIKRFNLKGDYSDAHRAHAQAVPDEYFIQIIEVHRSKQSLLNITFQHVSNEESGKQKSDYIEVSSLKDWIFICFCSLYLFFKRPTLSGYFTPYLLAFGAIILGILDRITNCAQHTLC